MAETQKPWVTVLGIVQHFKDQEVVTRREWNGTEYRDITLKTTTIDPETGKARLVKVSLYPEFEDVDFVEGGMVMAEGTLTVNPGKSGRGDFYNLNAKTLAYVAPIGRGERQVVNAAPETTETF